MEIKVKDRVQLKDNSGRLHSGVVISINEYREPCFKYAIDLDDYKEDLVFVGIDKIIKENKNA